MVARRMSSSSRLHDLVPERITYGLLPLLLRLLCGHSRHANLVPARGVGVGLGVGAGAGARGEGCCPAGEWGALLARVPTRRARVHPPALSPARPAPPGEGIRLGGLAPTRASQRGCYGRKGGAPAQLVGLDNLVHAPPEDEHARRRHHQSRCAALGQVAVRPNGRVASLGRHILRATHTALSWGGVRRAVRRAWRAWMGVGGESFTIGEAPSS